eukprot:m.167981 g.167981  ORF g.167981 m.167981 type:complete len:100 (+) comp31484_c0_seq1:767-1066(+)
MAVDDDSVFLVPLRSVQQDNQSFNFASHNQAQTYHGDYLTTMTRYFYKNCTPHSHNHAHVYHRSTVRVLVAQLHANNEFNTTPLQGIFIIPPPTFTHSH